MTPAAASPNLAEPAGHRMQAKRRLRSFARRHPLATLTIKLLLVALALRLYLGWSWSRQLAATRDEMRRGGHPAALAEIVLDDVPAAQNAAPLFTQAAASIRAGTAVNCPRNSVLNYPGYPPYGPAWEKQAAASEAGNANAFPIARAARQLARSQFRSGPLGIGSFLFGGYGPLRGLGNVLADGAEYKHLQGDDAEALDRLRDGYRLGRAIESDPLLVSQLVGWGIDVLMTDATQRIAPTLAVSSRSQPTSKAATADDVRALIAELLDEREGRDALVRCLESERAFLLDLYDQMSDRTWVIRPLADRNALDSIAISDNAIEASNARSAADARRILAAGALTASAKAMARPTLPNAAGGTPSTVPRYSRWFAIAVGQPAAYERVIDVYFRWSAERRVTAAILATRLYRIENGRWPERLTDLVPKFLPAVPADPFLPGGQPIGYALKRGALPDGGDRPLLYFEAGEDDASRTEAVIDAEPMFGWQVANAPAFKTPRQYRDAALWLPTTRRFDVEQKRQEEERKQLAEEGVKLDENQADAPGDEVDDHADPDDPPKQ
jgi:hypothetical protein